LTITDDVGHTATATTTVVVTNDLPTASFTFTPASPTAGSPVLFDATASTAVSGRTITSYSWSFGGSGATTSHTFPSAGTFSVTLTVTDSAGKTSSTTKTVTVS
jgi:chitinase